MVIRPFDDPTRCAQSVVADLAAISKGGFLTSQFGGLAGRGESGWAHSTARPWFPMSSLLTHIVYRVRF